MDLCFSGIKVKSFLFWALFLLQKIEFERLLRVWADPITLWAWGVQSPLNYYSSSIICALDPEC